MKTARYPRQFLGTSLFAVLLSAGVPPTRSHAQTASGYSFNSFSGVALEILSTPVQLIGANDDDSVAPVLGIGFALVYEGNVYTQFSTSTNGVVRLGDVAMDPVYGSNIASPNNTPRLMPLWADHTTNGGGQVRTSLEGAAPQRRRIVEWFVGLPYGADANSVFQLVLHEGTNEIEFRYGAGVAPSQAAIAIGGVSGQQFISVSPPAGSSTTVPDNDVSIWPGEGRSYVFAPLNSCPPLLPGASLADPPSTCSGMRVQLSLENPLSGQGLLYQWAASSDGVVWNDIPEAIEETFEAEVTSDLFYACDLTCPLTGESAQSAPVLVALEVPEVPYATYALSSGLLESFDTWTDLCSASDVPGMNWRNTPGFGQNSWRRHDEGTTTAGWTPSGWNVNMDPEEGGAARFHSRGSAGLVGTLDWYVDMSQANATTTLSFRYINSAGGGRLLLQRSLDGGLTFEGVGDTIGLSSPPFNTWIDVERTVSSTSATTVFRLLAIGPPTNAGNDIGVDELLLAPGSDVGVNEFDPAQVRVYPQPANSFVHAQWPGATLSRARLLDGCGRATHAPLQLTGDALHVDVSSIVPGLYMLELGTTDGALLRTPVLLVR